MPDRELPDLGNTVWRPLRADDADVMSALQQRCFVVDGGHRITAIEMREEFDRHGERADSDSIGAFDPSGRLLAFGWAQVPTGGRTEHRGFIWIEIDPDHRGVADDALLEFVEEAGTNRLRTFDDGIPLRLYRYGVYDRMTDAIALMKRHGYDIARYFTDNLRDLSLPIEDCPLDPTLVARTCSPEVESDALVVHNEAFADHWGSQPIQPHIWASFNAGEFFLPDTSWVVYDGSLPVSYVMSGKYPHDFPDRGRTEAWIEGVGTLRGHRRRGIASALITMAIRGFRDQGLEFARLGVDSENPTGANQIYERLGFFPEERTMTFTKAVDRTG
jgi:ribosomal protein S18 acetylase RimI-like enzyme